MTPIDKTRSSESFRKLWTDESTTDLQCYLYEFDAVQNRFAHVKSEHLKILLHYRHKEFTCQNRLWFSA